MCFVAVLECFVAVLKCFDISYLCGLERRDCQVHLNRRDLLRVASLTADLTTLVNESMASSTSSPNYSKLVRLVSKRSV